MINRLRTFEVLNQNVFSLKMSTGGSQRYVQILFMLTLCMQLQAHRHKNTNWLPRVIAFTVLALVDFSNRKQKNPFVHGRNLNPRPSDRAFLKRFISTRTLLNFYLKLRTVSFVGTFISYI